MCGAMDKIGDSWSKVAIVWVRVPVLPKTPIYLHKNMCGNVVKWYARICVS